MEKKDKLETLVELIVKALIIRSKLVVSALRVCLAIGFALTLLLGVGVGRVIQLMLS